MLFLTSTIVDGTDFQTLSLTVSAGEVPPTMNPNGAGQTTGPIMGKR